MADREVDLFVIGAGSGGVRAARIAAGYGAKVLVAEEYRVGGTCVIRGCVPKKLLVYASRFADEFEDAAGYGWTVPEPSFSWSSLIANKDIEIARLEAAYTLNVERSKAEIVKSRAEIEDAQHVRIVKTGERVRAKHILIATGGAPHHGAQIAGLEHVISSNEVFHLKELPKRILIQGGGYIAVEFAGIFAGLGSDVTLVYRRDNILRGFDDDVREHLRGEMIKRGIKIITNQTVSGIQKVEHGLCVELSDHESVMADQVMFATGRRPNVKGLGLEKVGVALNDRGAIAVDDYSKTSVPNIYAIGDVTDRVNLTPVAIREGHAFADTVFGGKDVKVDHTEVPTAVFSEPEVGVIGLTEWPRAKNSPASTSTRPPSSR
jgi:glutathione reductase (NADPH)